MQLTLRPGFVYILTSDNTSDVKLGKACVAEARAFELALGDPSLTVYRKEFFLDCCAAETALHQRFTEKRISRKQGGSLSETFAVTKRAAAKELDLLVTAQRAPMEEFTNACRYMADVGALTLDNSQEVAQCNGSALSVLLAHVPSPKDGRNVKQLVTEALSNTLASVKASKLLMNHGLLPIAIEDIVVLDKSQNSALQKVFNKKACAATWRTQLKNFAGINSLGRSVALDTWTDYTKAEFNIVERVSPTL